MSLPQASSFSAEVDQLTWILISVSGLIVMTVIGLLIFFAIKYRAGSQADRAQAPEKNRGLEIAMATVILAFGLLMFVCGSKLYYRMYAAPDNAVTIYVTAKQWMWKFHGPKASTINQLTLNLGQPVKLVMISEDVVHSFFVPAFRVKQDVLPGRYTSLWFTPTMLGDYTVLCTQFCGLNHSDMRAVIHVVPELKEARR